MPRYPLTQVFQPSLDVGQFSSILVLPLCVFDSLETNEQREECRCAGDTTPTEEQLRVVGVYTGIVRFAILCVQGAP
jgi:hypothetical protein